MLHDKIAPGSEKKGKKKTTSITKHDLIFWNSPGTKLNFVQVHHLDVIVGANIWWAIPSNHLWYRLSSVQLQRNLLQWGMEWQSTLKATYFIPGYFYK